jgi:phosphomannomutase
MDRKFVFDVDGTLTDSRQKIDGSFSDFFLDFCRSNEVHLVTGSDKPKTVEQLGIGIFDSVKSSHNCSGNEVWVRDTLVSKNEWNPSQELLEYLQRLLDKSKFPIRTGNHIEIRTGTLNFSIVGRNANMEQRKQYIEWDKSTNERERLVEYVTHRFDDVDALIGGETGIDLYERGKDKQQAVSFIKKHPTDIIYYFGDQIFTNGNDYKIAMLCDHRYKVKKWQDTYEILSYFKESGICK